MITPLDATWELFKARVENPPTRILGQIGEINVGKMQDIGKNHITKNQLTVVPKPLDNYESHAEIPQKISRGLANEIIRNLQIHKLPDGMSRHSPH